MFLLSMLALCGLAGGTLWAAIVVVQEAEAIYGAPQSNLGLPQRILYAVDLLRYKKDLTTPIQFTGTDGREFVIEVGEPVGSIAKRLEFEQFILSAEAFQRYLVYSGLDDSIQAGSYHIPSGLDALQLAEMFQDATPSEVSFGVLPGWRLEEIAGALPTSGLGITPDEFLRVAKHPETFAGYEWSEAPSVEGYILSSNYQIKRDASAAEMLRVMQDTLAMEITPEMRSGFLQQGLSVEQAVILASIVQREAVIVDEQPWIASVFLNRLAVGMRLESDPTVQYALGYDSAGQTWWKNPLTATDLQINSAYNTYVYGGLPPGPICSPSLSALRAVAFPVQTSYYFFRAKCDGSGYHDFSVTFEEHLQKACP
jgi:UPF0755 protein